MPIWLRYLLLQLPALVFLAILVAIFHRWGWIEAEAGVLVVLLWGLKDAVLYPFYQRSLALSVPDPGPASCVGRSGRCRTAVNGRGLVELGGERWMARSSDGTPISAGTGVVVVDHDGLVLVVRARPMAPGEATRAASEGRLRGRASGGPDDRA